MCGKYLGAGWGGLNQLRHQTGWPWSLALVWIVTILAAPALGQGVDWDHVTPKMVTTFFPGPSGWEMLLTQADHSGADKFRAGKECKSCHGGEERASGAAMLAQEVNAPAWLKARPPAIPVEMKVTELGGTLFVRLAFAPGNMADAGLDRDYETKVSIMLGDRRNPEIARGGCFAACHDDLPSMPDAVRPPITKYLGATRLGQTRKGMGQVIAGEQLARLARDGAALEYWQARLGPTGPAQLVEGYVLDRRVERADTLVSLSAERQGDRLILVFARPLVAPDDPAIARTTFAAGHSYMLAISIHAGHAAKRFHYVSLDQTLKVGSGAGAADFIIGTP
jgi:cytochrome c-type protein NapC